MATKYVVDAHTLIWYLENNPLLGKAAGEVLENPGSDLVLPAISLAEACWVVEKGRTRIPSVSNLLADVSADSRITIAALDLDTLTLAAGLSILDEMHDRQIVATALRLSQQGESSALLSKDENIRASGLVTVIW